MAISSFETGSLFSYSVDKMGEDSFNDIVKNYISKNSGKKSILKNFDRPV
jgi:hypothetical protein